MDRLYFDSSNSGYVTLDGERFVALRHTTSLTEERARIFLEKYNDQDELVARVEELARALPKGVKPDAFACAEITSGRMLYVVDFLRVRKEEYVLLQAEAAK